MGGALNEVLLYRKVIRYYKQGVEDVSEPLIVEYSQSYCVIYLVQTKGMIQNVVRGVVASKEFSLS